MAEGVAAGRGLKRVAIVAGLRTPFARANGVFGKLTALELGKIVVSELIARTGLDRQTVDLLTFGQVIPSVSAPNIAREIVLSTALPPTVDAYSVSRACATSIQSTTSAADQIALGHAEIAIAGGAECLSDIPFIVSRPLADALVSASRARDLGAKIKSFAHLSARDLVPIAPGLKEPSTGLTMGESAEKMARENGIGREEQDRFAKRSHDLAAKAWEEGRFEDEVMHVLIPPKFEEAATVDDYVRKDTTLEKMAALKPVFDRKYGTITAASSSGLTDGAAALVLMSEERAKALGHTPLGYLRDYTYVAVDPKEQMLIGPAYSTPKILERTGLSLQDFDLVEIHEAFAAVVLSVRQKLASKKFAEEKLGRSAAVGEIDDAKLNVNGGAIALGHPFGATGARMILTTLNELKRRGGNLGLISICAAGGLAASVVLERE